MSLTTVPGRLIGYPIFDLRSLHNPATGKRLGPVDFVRLMEEALIRVCGDFGVAAGRICGLTGVWCHLRHLQWASPSDESCVTTGKDAPAGERKIAAIGIHVARGVTSHGFAFNVTTDLRDFALINPCGITDRQVTSLEREIADPKSLPSLESLACTAARHFGHVFDEPVALVDDLTALRAHSGTHSDPQDQEFPAQEFPANDTPLQIPPEIERLRHKKERPIPA